jgi:hypothetical protein
VSAPDALADPRATLRARLAAHRRPPLADVLRRRGLGSYRGYGEVLAALDALADRGAAVAVAGRSSRGEPVFALRLGEAPGRFVRTSVVVSAVHPMEWIGLETCLSLLHRLAERPPAGRAVVVFPVLNPDGVLRVEANLRAGARRFVRHNARGVDLNRNFDAAWDQKSVLQALFPRLYCAGEHPASEPEVAAITRELAPLRVDRAISLHSFGGAVLYPRASSRRPIADREEHRAHARHIARAADPRPYRVTACSWLVPGFTATGLELDWFHERHGALSLLVECSRGGASLHPSRLAEPFAWYNPPHVDRVASRLAAAIEPFVRGDPSVTLNPSEEPAGTSPA